MWNWKTLVVNRCFARSTCWKAGSSPECLSLLATRANIITMLNTLFGVHAQVSLLLLCSTSFFFEKQIRPPLKASNVLASPINRPIPNPPISNSLNLPRPQIPKPDWFPAGLQASRSRACKVFYVKATTCIFKPLAAQASQPVRDQLASNHSFSHTRTH